MSEYINILSYINGDKKVLAAPVSKSVQTKYDHMTRHNLHVIFLRHALHGVEVAIVSEGIQLDQRFCPNLDDKIISTLADAINFADVPRLIKLKQANMEARPLTGRKQ